MCTNYRVLNGSLENKYITRSRPVEYVEMRSVTFLYVWSTEYNPPDSGIDDG